MQRPIIDQHPVKQTAYRRDIKNHGYKSVITNYWLVRQRNWSWIKGLGKNPQKSELCLQCLLSGATEPYTRQPAQWHATDDVLTRLPAKMHINRNACLDALRSPFQQKNCVFIRHPMRTGWWDKTDSGLRHVICLIGCHGTRSWCEETHNQRETASGSPELRWGGHAWPH